MSPAGLSCEYNTSRHMNNKIDLAFTAIKELGPQKLTLFAIYKLGLKTGFFKAVPRPRGEAHPGMPADLRQLMCQWIDLFPVDAAVLLDKANEVVEDLSREPGTAEGEKHIEAHTAHWTHYESGKETTGAQDIKHIWEPARFNWAFALGRAYLLGHNEAYPQLFWRKFDEFQQQNPPYRGPNWMSAQEVGLRMLAFIFAGQVFDTSPTYSPERQRQLSLAIADHARRIPPTLVYARSQNNNHLVSEAVALYSAACALPDHPQTRQWRKLGWKWFNQAIQHQVSLSGSYVQHSTNYHRLVLMLAMWMKFLAEGRGQLLPVGTTQRLQAATGWLAPLVDEHSGKVPNLGANDGANILAVSRLDFVDFLPVLEAAQKVFGQPHDATPGLSDMPRLENTSSHAFLRVAHFSDRPSHADQLHLDLWWRGANILRDAGTFSYNAHSPWTNALSVTRVHNTLTLDDRDQMTAVSRFLWLKWAQAEVLETILNEKGKLIGLTAQHDGYKRRGYLHMRSVSAYGPDQWVVDDRLAATKHAKNKPLPILKLHWRLPDLPWTMTGSTLSLQGEPGTIRVSVRGADQLVLFRAGKLIYGEAHDDPLMGWYSPDYDVKEPAISLVALKTNNADLSFTTFIMLGG